MLTHIITGAVIVGVGLFALIRTDQFYRADIQIYRLLKMEKMVRRWEKYERRLKLLGKLAAIFIILMGAGLIVFAFINK